MENLNEIQKNIGLDFQNPELLEIALTHRSYLNEHQGAKLQNNERQEYLGDAVLELIISDYIFRKYPDKEEPRVWLKNHESSASGNIFKCQKVRKIPVVKIKIIY